MTNTSNSNNNNNNNNNNCNDPYTQLFNIKPHQQIFAACGGALVTTLTMTPLDVVKVRLQAQQKRMLSNKCYLYCNGLMDHLCPCGPSNISSPPHYTGTIDALIKISKIEGIKSLWSGLSPTLILAIPTTATYFVLYEHFKNILTGFFITRETETRPVWIPLLAGSAARIVAVTTVSPLELIRTKMQSEKRSVLEVRESVKGILKTDGVLGLWRGLAATVMRDVPFSALYWMSYETIKSEYGRRNPSDNSFLFNFTAGGISGCIAAVFTLPFDVIKTHQQIDLGEKEIFANGKKGRSKNTLEMMKHIYKKNGTRGLFAGISPRIIKVAPACAIMIASFEYGKTYFYDYNKRMFYEKYNL